MKKCIILANGKPPKKSEILFLQKSGFSTLICADGGANTALRFGLIPDYIIGDLDSVESKTLDHFKDRSQIIKYSRQNDTDVEKALKFAVRKKFNKAILLGGTGDRLDHSFCNLGIALKFDDKISVEILYGKTLLTVVTGQISFNTIKGEIISLYGFNQKTKITSAGLKYPLNRISLPFGEKESTSNEAVGVEVNLRVTGGKIFLIREYRALKRIGYFF